MAVRLRICWFCHQTGITVTFPNGNQMKRHIRDRHPQTREQVEENKSRLREYRRRVLLAQERLRSLST